MYCHHPYTVVTYKISKSGQKLYCKQCSMCGQQVGGWISPKGYFDHKAIVNAIEFKSL